MEVLETTLRWTMMRDEDVNLLHKDVDRMSNKDLKELVKMADLDSRDCVEKSDLRALGHDAVLILMERKHAPSTFLDSISFPQFREDSLMRDGGKPLESPRFQYGDKPPAL